MNNKKIGYIIAISLSISACSSYYASNAERAYLQSRSGPALVVPPNLTTINISHFYDLPPQTKDARVSIKPPQVVGKHH